MFLVIALVLLIFFYFYAKRNHDYWKNRNIKHDPPKYLFGNKLDVQLGYVSHSQKCYELCKKYPEEKLIGFYRGIIPELIITDAEIAKQILHVDFLYFHRRGFHRNTEIDPLFLNLFTVDGDKWKLLRQRLTPTFTTAKLKSMFPLIVNCAEKLQALIENEIIESKEQCDVRKLMGRFTTEFIGACGFGIEMDTINNEKSLFIDLERKIFHVTPYQFFKIHLFDLIPEIRKFLYTSNKEVEDTLFDVVRRICEQRNYKPIGRNDFIDLFLEIYLRGKMRGESIENFNKDGKPIMIEKEFDFRVFVAQAFLFFAAGSETSSSATSSTLHQLAFHPDIQTKVQEEIDSVLLKYNNKLCYDAVCEMKYLHMAFKEALRLMPAVETLNRECVRKYKIPGTDIVLDPGVKISVPVLALHMNEKYFDKPEEFIPERFLPENGEPRHKYAYLPFGEGPRICIGARLGEMQGLAGLVAFLQKFSVEPAGTTKRIPIANPWSNVVTLIKGGMPLKIVPRYSKPNLLNR